MATALTELLIGHDAAIVERHDPLGARGDVGIVCRDHEREGEPRLQRVDQVEDPRAGVGVELPRRLIAQQKVRLLPERPRDRDPLRLAA